MALIWMVCIYLLFGIVIGWAHFSHLETTIPIPGINIIHQGARIVLAPFVDILAFEIFVQMILKWPVLLLPTKIDTEIIRFSEEV